MRKIPEAIEDTQVRHTSTKTFTTECAACGHKLYAQRYELPSDADAEEIAEIEDSFRQECLKRRSQMTQHLMEHRTCFMRYQGPTPGVPRFWCYVESEEHYLLSVDALIGERNVTRIPPRYTGPGIYVEYEGRDAKNTYLTGLVPWPDFIKEIEGYAHTVIAQFEQTIAEFKKGKS